MILKNFSLACFTFLIWALFGAWVHTYRHPKYKLKPAKIEKVHPVIVERTTNNTMIKEKVKKDSILKKPPIKEAPTQTFDKTASLNLGAGLYFNQKDFDEDITLETYVSELKKKLKNNPKLHVYIVGYTDSIGDSIANYWVGFERAKNFKSFLMSQDIDK